MLDRRHLERELTNAEKRVRSATASRRIEGSARKDLLAHATDAAKAALTWCNTVDASETNKRRSSGADAEVVAALLSGASAAREHLIAGLGTFGPGAGGAERVLANLYALVSGTPLRGGEISVPEQRPKDCCSLMLKSSARPCPRAPA